MRKKDKERFFELIDENYKSLEKFTLYLTQNRDSAKDLIQDTILAAFDSFKSLVKEEAFLSFVFTICSRTFYKSKNNKYERSAQEPDELLANDLSIEDKTDLKLIYEEINNLNLEEREILLLHEIVGFKYKEIAEIKQISIENVKVKIHRTKKKLIENLKINEEVKNEKS